MFAESNAIPLGPSPTDTVAITELVAVLITETVSSVWFTTYILLFAESNAIPEELSPTSIFAIKPLVAVLITETEELSGAIIRGLSLPQWFLFTTYILLFAESNAMLVDIFSPVVISEETE